MANRLFIEFHILQTVPPSNINRDDTGSPKTAVFGGVRRSRVSSQAWKKATRGAFALLLDGEDLGTRTKFAVDLIAERIVGQRPDLASEANALAVGTLESAGMKITPDKTGKQATGALFFLGSAQAVSLATLAIAAHEDGIAIDKKLVKSVLDVKKNVAANAVDIALFGRMVAEAPDLNVDAACQVAHAISIHRADTEFDYFTAVDDRSPDDNAGAGMIGTVEFTSSTLYRYATIDVPHLKENLGDSTEATVRAVRAFANAFVLSMPTGKQNTFANRTLPAAVLVQLRNTQPVSLVNAFEQPIEPGRDKSRTKLACDALVLQDKTLNDAFGVSPSAAFVVLGSPDADGLASIGESVSLEELGERLDEAIRTWGQG